ncbi:hypothetical protein HCCG_01283 [Helicobacter cinaedi CCUG 18818 = ATCC BAA-847]|uniref:Uncharacterized protein n=1 Tax=Helicobacter cinaedi CCUG 18818 = ATCC BAA-847 TaxID=537971 RepID=A0ABN0BB00_9HELI|nr:hypothetical protein HCCG_01283 [Helicobacter cinaedi CCUG 18818 = ATCC BAA-847]
MIPAKEWHDSIDCVEAFTLKGNFNRHTKDRAFFLYRILHS